MAHNNASDMIEEALNAALSTADDYVAGDLLVEWVLVAYVTNPDEEEGSAYPVFYSNGNMPTHRAMGLLQKGMQLTVDQP